MPTVYLAALSKAVEGFVQRSLATPSKVAVRVPSQAAGSFVSTSKLSAADVLCLDSSNSTYAQCNAQLCKVCRYNVQSTKGNTGSLLPES